MVSELETMLPHIFVFYLNVAKVTLEHCFLWLSDLLDSAERSVFALFYVFYSDFPPLILV